MLLRKLCSELITLFVALREYLRLSGPTYSDLGITGKIFSSCRLKKLGISDANFGYKVITPELEQGPRLVAAGCGRYWRQLFKY